MQCSRSTFRKRSNEEIHDKIYKEFRRREMKPRQWILIALVFLLSVAVRASVGAEPAAQGAGQAAAPSGAPPRPSEAARAAVAKRQPINTIKDSRSVFSAIDVDPVRNELIAGDENNFNVRVYDRTTNTPPKAALSEPKRSIQGDHTFL